MEKGRWEGQNSQLKEVQRLEEKRVPHWKLLLSLKLYGCYLDNDCVTVSYVRTECVIENCIGRHLTVDCVIGSMRVLTMWLEFTVRTVSLEVTVKLQVTF